MRRNTGLTAGLADDLEFSYPKPEDGGSKEQTAEEKTLEEQHYAANPVKSAWAIYSADEDFVKLEASLDVRGDREAHLKESFAEHRVAIVEVRAVPFVTDCAESTFNSCILKLTCTGTAVGP